MVNDLACPRHTLDLYHTHIHSDLDGTEIKAIFFIHTLPAYNFFLCACNRLQHVAIEWRRTTG